MRQDVERIAKAANASLGPRLSALLLVGGYGRGEGGAVAVAESAGGAGFAPYNDYDLIAVVSHDASSARDRLNAVGRELTSRLGVHVDFWAISERAMWHPPPTLFWLDVALGGVRVLAGDARVLDSTRSLRARSVPLDEAGRLLANRAVGLALSNLAPRIDDEAVRHVHKAVLAVGDARLLDCDRYRGTVRERLIELERLVDAPSVGADLVEAYAAAARFRERPDLHARPAADIASWYVASRERIAKWHLDFEARRIGSPRDPLGFGRFAGRLYPRLADVKLGGAFASAMRATLRLRLPISPWVGHPRERVARAAILLAYAVKDPTARALAAHLLGIRTRGMPLAESPSDAELREHLSRLLPFGG